MRKYCKCASATDLTRTISYCSTPSGEILNKVALVQYNFKGEEHKFKLLGHGNAKSNHVAPYQTTKESTKAHLRLTLIGNVTSHASRTRLPIVLFNLGISLFCWAE